MILEKIFHLKSAETTVRKEFIAGFTTIYDNGLYSGRKSVDTGILNFMTYSIRERITFGVTGYAIVNLITGKIKNISVVLIILAILFILRYFLI